MPGRGLGGPGVLERFLQADDLFAKPPFDLRGLVRFRADSRVELLLEVGVPLLQSHAVNTGFRSERDHGEAAIGAGGLSGQEAVHGRADAGAFVKVLFVHATASSAVWAAESCASASARKRSAVRRSRSPRGWGTLAAFASSRSACFRAACAWLSVRTALPQPNWQANWFGAVAPGSGSHRAVSRLNA